MYQATYVPAFYRALHTLVHNEFRTGKLVEGFKASIGWQSMSRLPQIRGAVALIGLRLKHPFLHRRVDRLERLSPEPTVNPRAAHAAPAVAGKTSDLKAS
jgi:hypothetical protein